MNSPAYKTGDVVQYARKFWVLYAGVVNTLKIVDNPMIIIDFNKVARDGFDTVEGKNRGDYFIYRVMQGDKQFEIAEEWLEFVK